MHVRLALLAVITLMLAGCGFHLRRSANLPDAMQQVRLSVSGSSAFRRALTRAVGASGVTVVEQPGPDVAELRVSQARFRNQALTITGQGRISEYAVHFDVKFHVEDGHGKTVVPPQHIDLSREFTYDASHAIGQGTQREAIRKSLVQDMVQSVMFRLQAAGSKPAAAVSAAPAAAASTAG